jgi:hypothetical protein
MRLLSLTLFAVTIVILPLPASLHAQGEIEEHAQGEIEESAEPSNAIVQTARSAARQEYFYKNKLEFSLNSGWLPINIPFVFDCFVGDTYNMTPLKYTLVPTLASLRWQMGHVSGPWILRGNFDMTFSLAVTAIPRGPETHYVAYDTGMRRNFVYGSGRAAPYFDIHLGVGDINAKGPLGVPFAQGQNLTFTYMMGSGLRLNINSRYSIEGGLNYMHVSNMYLSEPRYINYGINVYGPMFGLNVRVGKPRQPHVY